EEKPGDSRDDPAEEDTGDSAEAGKHHRFEQKLDDNIETSSSDRLPYADLLGPLRYGDQHDVHHADAAHQKTDRTKDNHDEKSHGRDLAEIGDHLIRRGKSEIVGLGVFHALSIRRIVLTSSSAWDIMPSRAVTTNAFS